MELIFKKILTLNDGSKTFLSHEPTNDFIEYYMDGKRISNKSTKPFMGDFDDLTLRREPRRMTSQAVVDFGIKTFPKIGSYGYYTPMYTPGSMVVIPINRLHQFSSIPVVTVTDVDPEIHLDISGNYDCYRIVIRNDYVATEFITYNKEFDFIPMYTGTCTLSVIGHLDEIAVTSQPFELEMELVDRLSPPEEE